MKKHLAAGLAIILPVVLTTMILAYLINFLTYPFQGMVKLQLKKIAFFNQYPLLLNYISKCVILGFLCGITLLIGWAGRIFLLRYLFYYTDKLIQKIPLVKSLYKSSKEVINTFLNKEKTSFSKVVLVPFPHKKALCIGLVTDGHDSKNQTHVSILLPGAPNPTMGFILLFSQEQIIETNLTVEQAFKIVISGGLAFNHR